jgi:hypothetical protein
METSRRMWRGTIRKVFSLAISIVSAGFLFFYLSETSLQWRIALSVLLFLATYIMTDGFLMRE